MANNRRNINKIYHKRELELRQEAAPGVIKKTHPPRLIFKSVRPAR